MIGRQGKNDLILIIEDNEDHAILVKKALRGNGLINNTVIAPTGEIALDYLFRRGNYSNPTQSPRPSLILLDIKLPGIDGIEVLREINRDAKLRPIPIIMLTTSAQESDLAASYGNGVNSYIQKPIDFSQFVETVQGLGMYWLMTNTPPPAPSPG
jgi:two-component system, response regulator